MDFRNIFLSAVTASGYSIMSILFVALVFFGFEPIVSRSATATSNFTIAQTINGEIAFLVNANNVTMTGAINGLTGGNATGTTQAVVQTNSPTGYTLGISFGSSSPAMMGVLASSTGIRDYAASTTPTFVFTASTSAVFAYTVGASTTLDIAQSFRDNGATCGVGTTDTANACWRGPTTTVVQIVNRSTAAATGATTTIQFRVNVPSNPVPAVNADTYTATATLTAVNQ